MDDLITRLQEDLSRSPDFANFLGMRLRSATRDEIVADLEIRPDLGQSAGIAHGGVLMSFADTLGGIGASVNLPPGTATITLESKTNFLAPAPVGSIVTGRSEILHRGRRTTVWQTRISNAAGRLLAQVIQTQMVIELRQPAL
jgi:1,4-dihydroxy-2-naphthoyl-CoA hydrolase